MRKDKKVYPVGLSPTSFPYQKRSSKAKNEEFFKDCVEVGASLVQWHNSSFESQSVRSVRRNKISNYNLVNDIIDKKEVEMITNPLKLKDTTFPATYRNYPLINPAIGVLVGEERKRLFNYVVSVVNPDSINEKLEYINQEYLNFILQNVNGTQQLNEQQMQEKLAQLNKWRLSFRDRRERMGSQILEYLYRSLDLKEHFSKGFEDLLISAEEIYVTDIYGGEPVMRRGNPLNFFTLRSGESWKIEDSDIIVEDGYLPIGEVIDRYYEYLSDEDISKLEKGYTFNAAANSSLFTNQLVNPTFNIDNYIEQVGIGTIIQASGQLLTSFGGYFDQAGNARVCRVLWKGLRKIGIVSYYDEQGDIQKKYVPEEYVANKDQGEEVEWVWISEWYEGTRIADNIYVKMEPRKVQIRHMDNISRCHPGIVGSVFNINSNKGRSLVDMIKDYQYLYNAIMYNTQLTMARNKGKIARMNVNLIPDGWDMDKWLYYAETVGWAVEDPFNEGQKGAALGKLAGGASGRQDVFDLEQGTHLQTNMIILDFIRKQVEELTGVPPQRKGAIDNRETVGGVERAVTQSSLGTEKWFGIHDNTKIRALKALLETAKIAWKDNKVKRSYILDDGTQAILDFDGNEFAESEYGIDISNSSSDQEMMGALKSLIPPFMQNGGPLSIVMDLYRTKNPASLQKKIESYEDEMKQQAQQAQQNELQVQQQAQQQMLQIEMEKLQLEKDRLELDLYEIDSNNETKIYISEINSFAKQENQDSNNNGIPDQLEVGKLALAEREAASKSFKEQLDIAYKDKESQRKQQIEEKKLALDDKKMKLEEKLTLLKEKNSMEKEKIKARTALKNVVTGERKK